MSRIAEALGVSRSLVSKSLSGGPSTRPARYSKAEDVELLPRIRAIVDERPTNGYRRVTARLNRRFRDEGLHTVNHKRVYRIMRQNDLLLQRYTGKNPRAHEGRVITLKSNLRWCSDAFQIRCWSGERVEVAFSLDCCDREVMAYVATSGAITGEMIRDLMALSIESRFGAGTTRVPQAIEWLSDNGPPYTAYETRSFASESGLLACTTPAYSPESNGMAEGFVKLFKRDYVYINDLPDAARVIAKLAGWFDDYNETHPHQGLKMQSPREYRRNQLGH